jgi:Uma2 family endonuclease
LQSKSLAVVTAADLLDQLAVPPERIWLNPPPGKATEQDVVYADDHLDRLCELVDGTLVEKPMGSRESLVAIVIASILRSFVAPRKLGFVLGEAGMFRLFPGRVRLPDVAFVSLARLPNGMPADPITNVSPDLAVEVLSKSNTSDEMEKKRHEYFSSGVRLVWVVNAEARTVAVYTQPQGPDATKSRDELLDGGAVLPEFSVRVSELFAELDLKAEQ